MDFVKHAITTAEQFERIFYEALDKRRNLISKLYMDNAVVCWNGHAHVGSTEIQRFYDNLAPTQHTVICLDAVPLSDTATDGEKAILIHTAGTVRLKSATSTVVRSFVQTFVICPTDSKWKVVSDIFRTVNVPGSLVL